MSHPFTRRRQGLQPIRQPAKRKLINSVSGLETFGNHCSEDRISAVHINVLCEFVETFKIVCIRDDMARCLTWSGVGR